MNIGGAHTKIIVIFTIYVREYFKENRYIVLFISTYKSEVYNTSKQRPQGLHRLQKSLTKSCRKDVYNKKCTTIDYDHAILS